MTVSELGTQSRWGSGLRAKVASKVERPVSTVERPAMGIVSERPARILLAEDDPAARDGLQLMLEKHGFGVGVANDGLEAIEMAQTYHPDIALIDVSLPLLDGYEVARRIRASLAGKRPIQMVAMLGHSRDYRRALESGFVQDLLKPIDPRLLLTMLDRLVG